MSKDAWDEMEAKAASIRAKKLEEENERIEKRKKRQTFLAGIQVKNNWSRTEMTEGLKAKAGIKLNPLQIAGVLYNSADHVLKQLFPTGDKTKTDDPLN